MVWKLQGMFDADSNGCCCSATSISFFYLFICKQINPIIMIFFSIKRRPHILATLFPNTRIAHKNSKIASAEFHNGKLKVHARTDLLVRQYLWQRIWDVCLYLWCSIFNPSIEIWIHVYVYVYLSPQQLQKFIHRKIGVTNSCCWQYLTLSASILS